MATNFNKPQSSSFRSSKATRTQKSSTNWLVILPIVAVIALFVWLITNAKSEVIGISIIIVLLASLLTTIIMMSMNKVALFTNKADKALIIISAICFLVGGLITEFSQSIPAGAIILYIIAGICFIFSAFNSTQINRGFVFGIIITILAKAAIVYLIAVSILLWIVLLIFFVIFFRSRVFY